MRREAVEQNADDKYVLVVGTSDSMLLTRLRAALVLLLSDRQMHAVTPSVPRRL